MLERTPPQYLQVAGGQPQPPKNVLAVHLLLHHNSHLVQDLHLLHHIPKSNFRRLPLFEQFAPNVSSVSDNSFARRSLLHDLLCRILDHDLRLFVDLRVQTRLRHLLSV
jgi:hypothetical protein